MYKTVHFKTLQSGGARGRVARICRERSSLISVKYVVNPDLLLSSLNCDCIEVTALPFQWKYITPSRVCCMKVN